MSALDDARNALGFAANVAADANARLEAAQQRAQEARNAFADDTTDVRWRAVESAERDEKKATAIRDKAVAAHVAAQSALAAAERAADEARLDELLIATSMEQADEALAPHVATLGALYPKAHRALAALRAIVAELATKHAELAEIAARLGKPVPHRAVLSDARATALLVRAITRAAIADGMRLTPADLRGAAPVTLPRPYADEQELAVEIARLCGSQIDAAASLVRGGDRTPRVQTMSAVEQADMIVRGLDHHAEIATRRAKEKADEAGWLSGAAAAVKSMIAPKEIEA